MVAEVAQITSAAVRHSVMFEITADVVDGVELGRVGREVPERDSAGLWHEVLADKLRAMSLQAIPDDQQLLADRRLQCLHELEHLGRADRAGVEAEVEAPERGPIDVPLNDGDTLSVGAATGTVLHTPGHTQGSVCLHFGETLFAGDTLFQGSIGRTDLPGGNTKQIFRSIKDKLLVLPDETIVIPGHGDLTTIGDERDTNPFLRDL